METPGTIFRDIFKSNSRINGNLDDPVVNRSRHFLVKRKVFGLNIWLKCSSLSFIFWLIIFSLFLDVTSKVEGKEKNFTSSNKFSWVRGSRHIAPLPTLTISTLPPTFDQSVATNISVTAFKNAVLSCIVHNLGNNSVSWIRHRDLHILAVAKETYTNDDRFQIVARESNGDWSMQIKYAIVRDSGPYDCQVSSRPPISKTFHLNVVEPRARVLRAPEMHVGAGSLINLTCIISYSPEPLEFLYWYHKQKVVREDGYRIFIQNHLSTRSSSQLLIKNAHPRDSGIYACSPANSREHSVTVHVVSDGYPAAMQGGSSVTSVGHKKLLWLMTAPLFIALVTSHKPYFYM